MDDSRIVDLFLSRDERALTLARERYSLPLRSIALGITGDRRDAEECESDALLGAWNAIPPHEPRGYLFAFLARMVRHAALDRCRLAGRKKRDAELLELSAELEECIPAPDDTACRVEGTVLTGAVSAFLRGQSEEARRLFLRRYWYCDPVRTAAARLGMSESKAKSMLMRTRNKLKDYLISEGYEL